MFVYFVPFRFPTTPMGKTRETAPSLDGAVRVGCVVLVKPQSHKAKEKQRGKRMPDFIRQTVTVRGRWEYLRPRANSPEPNLLVVLVYFFFARTDSNPTGTCSHSREDGREPLKRLSIFHFCFFSLSRSFSFVGLISSGFCSALGDWKGKSAQGEHTSHPVWSTRVLDCFVVIPAHAHRAKIGVFFVSPWNFPTLFEPSSTGAWFDAYSDMP